MRKISQEEMNHEEIASRLIIRANKDAEEEGFLAILNPLENIIKTRVVAFDTPNPPNISSAIDVGNQNTGRVYYYTVDKHGDITRKE